MPCKESQIEVVCDVGDDYEPFLFVVCGGCGKRIERTEKGWRVIDYALIREAVQNHILDGYSAAISNKWQALRSKIRPVMKR